MQNMDEIKPTSVSNPFPPPLSMHGCIPNGKCVCPTVILVELIKCCIVIASVEWQIKYLELLDVLKSSELLILVACFTIPLQERRKRYNYTTCFVVVRLAVHRTITNVHLVSYMYSHVLHE